MAADTDEMKILFLFDDENPISALDLSAFIFDLNRIYVLALRYHEFGYDSVQDFRNYGRNSFRLPRGIRLDVSRIRFESPGLIELTTALLSSATAIWIIIQTLEKITSWPLNRRKLKLEVEKLERELNLPPRLPQRKRLEPFLDLPDVKSATRQLESNSLKPVDIKLFPGK